MDVCQGRGDVTEREKVSEYSVSGGMWRVHIFNVHTVKHIKLQI